MRDPTPHSHTYVHESPFAELLDMRVSDPQDGTSKVEMPIGPGHLQQAGRVQGQERAGSRGGGRADEGRAGGESMRPAQMPSAAASY